MSALFSSLTIRGVTVKNRIAVSPMSQYRAQDGHANHWHLVHLGRFALGGAGLVFAEATAVEPDGRRTHGDLGLWSDAHIEELIPICTFLEAEGSLPGIQLGHAGRKASERRPWQGETPVDAEDVELRGEAPWAAIAPSPVPYADGWPTPQEMSEADIERVIAAFASAARRSVAAGFRFIEIYAAHGFLVHQFLSPLANMREDKWGATPEGRRRFAVEVAGAIRKAIPESIPLSFRLSATDWVDGGVEVEDTVETAKALKAAGVDMIDCSTGGIGGRERPRRMTLGQGFQVPFAEQVKHGANLHTMAVGFLWDAKVCEEVISSGQADMVALARELLLDPNWPNRVSAELGAGNDHSLWPPEAGWWLMKRERLCEKLGLR